MKNKSKNYFGVLLSILLVLSITGCGEVVNNNTQNDCAKFVQELTNLDNKAIDEQISDEEFLIQYKNILDKIENTPNGTELFKKYLEDNILGYKFTWSAKNSGKNSTLDLIDDIKEMGLYDMMGAFFQSVIFAFVPEPAATLIQVANSNVFITLSSLQVRTHIIDAMSKDVLKEQELLDILRTNPFEAERQLLLTQKMKIPAWLEPAPSNALRNVGVGGLEGTKWRWEGVMGNVFQAFTLVFTSSTNCEYWWGDNSNYYQAKQTTGTYTYKNNTITLIMSTTWSGEGSYTNQKSTCTINGNIITLNGLKYTKL